MPNAREIAEKLRDSDTWNLDDCGDLCHAVGFGEEWDAAAAEDFERIIVQAGNLVGVEIL